VRITTPSHQSSTPDRLGLGVLLDLCRTGLGVKGVKVLGCPVDVCSTCALPRRTPVSVSMSVTTSSKDIFTALAARASATDASSPGRQVQLGIAGKEAGHARWLYPVRATRTGPNTLL